MKKWLTGGFLLLVAVLGFIFIPIMYDYFMNRSYGSEAVEADVEGPWETAVFAGGCFWCMEPPFEKVEGVDKAVSGYTGGPEENPSYEDVASGETGHVEAVQVTYDPELVSYEELLEIYWRQIDPTDDEGQFVDRGYQYSPHIFYQNDEEREAAEASKEDLEASGRFSDPIVVDIRELDTFYVAEDYHQDFYKENPVRYEFYRSNSGRDEFIDDHWGEEAEYETAGSSNLPFWRQYEPETEEELRGRLTNLQFEVTQEDATEPAYHNPYWDNTETGIYVDIVSGEPLFRSKDQFDSGTGWPSFTKPIAEEFIETKADWSMLIKRTEVRSAYADSHLGHVFEDGPEPDGLRYCMNSAAMKFIPVEEMEAEGYGDYIDIVEQ
ncbi:peptide-methionine (R)-S-oxide reductase MsrB [Alkalicoccus luteus]|uniref:peptide-methionine (R)-S-oxide reductase MsrB n=1 Tax=Alkalicoccus luteus TaxID=1237094 RepID=UPI0040336F5E